MPKSRFVTAWNKNTGEKQRIPATWVDHPELGKPFTTTEPAASTTAPADGAPDAPLADVTPTQQPTTTTKASAATKGK